MHNHLKRHAELTGDISSADPSSPTVDWSHIQSLFERCKSSVLLLLDCCAAASSAPRLGGKTTVEMLAACGFESRAPPPGEHSFTTSLIEVLEDWCDGPPFSILMLHNAVFKVLMRRRKERCRNGQRLEWRSTPFHVSNCSHPRAVGIELCKRTLPNATAIPNPPILQIGAPLVSPNGPMSATAYLHLMSLKCTELDERPKIDGQQPIGDGITSPPPEDSTSDDSGNIKLPHMLVYLTLDQDHALSDADAVACRRWVSSFSSPAKQVRVEGVYRNHSTILLLSVPVEIWDMLPDHPACQPITRITSQNLVSDLGQEFSCNEEESASETDSVYFTAHSRSSSFLNPDNRPSIPPSGEIAPLPVPIQDATISSVVNEEQETEILFSEPLPDKSVMLSEALHTDDEADVDKSPSQLKTSHNSQRLLHTIRQRPPEVSSELDEEFLEALEYGAVPAPLRTEAQMKQLQIVDMLQDLGIDHEVVDLPRLVVCGDQTSGKSSVLGAITRIPFPRQAQCCTRFVTQIILRHDPLIFSKTVTIVPGRGRDPTDRTRIEAFRGEILHDFSNLPAVTIAATKEIFTQSTQRYEFAEDILRIEIRGKGQQSLEIMDLPGLICNDQRNGRDVEAVARIIKTHIQNPRSIVLVVVGADNDLRGHFILHTIDQIPGCRERAVGIITKPDVPRDQNLDTYIELANNRSTGYVYEWGWHVVRNSTFEELNSKETWDMRDKREEEFFQTSEWKQLLLIRKSYDSVEQRLGIYSLRKRLIDMLSALSRREIPNLRREIQKHLALYEGRLRELGGERKLEDMKQRLVKGCSRLARSIRDFSRGMYDSRGLTLSINDPDLFLRSRIRDLEDEFTWTIHNFGHTYAPDHFPLTTTPDADNPGPNNRARKKSFPPPKSLSQREFYAGLLHVLNRTGGEESPTYFDPQRISLIFQEQSDNWDAISSEFLRDFCDTCERFLQSLIRLEFRTETDVPGRLWKSFLGENFARLKANANDELQKLLLDRHRPVKTQSIEFIAQTQNMRSSRIFSNFNNALRDQLQSDAESVMDSESVTKKLGMLILKQQQEQIHASFLDDMLLYYVVSLLSFIRL
jgi:hypothetical protein